MFYIQAGREYCLLLVSYANGGINKKTYVIYTGICAAAFWSQLSAGLLNQQPGGSAPAGRFMWPTSSCCLLPRQPLRWPGLVLPGPRQLCCAGRRSWVSSHANGAIKEQGTCAPGTVLFSASWALQGWFFPLRAGNLAILGFAEGKGEEFCIVRFRVWLCL